MALEWNAACHLVVAAAVVVVLMPVLAMLQIVAIMELSLVVVLKAFSHHSIRMALEWVAALHLVAAAVVVVLLPVLAMLQGVALQATVLRASQSVVLALERAIWL